jgi:hypothetical protein
VIKLKKFKLRKYLFKGTLNDQECDELFDLFLKNKYIDKDNILSIRFFMFYQNYFLYLPHNLEPRRKEVFDCINKLNFTERDFMQSKADFKKKPVGFKD